MTNLSRYPHPGKFEGGLLIDQVAYDWSLLGADDEFDFGNDGFVDLYSAMRGPFATDEQINESNDYGLTADDIAYLNSVVACVVHEDNQGFVTVTWYDDEPSYLAELANLQSQYDDFLAETADD